MKYTILASIIVTSMFVGNAAATPPWYDGSHNSVDNRDLNEIENNFDNENENRNYNHNYSRNESESYSRSNSRSSSKSESSNSVKIVDKSKRTVEAPMSVYAPSLQPTATCIVTYSAGVGVPGFSGSAGGGTVDEACEAREAVRLGMVSGDAETRGLANRLLQDLLKKSIDKLSEPEYSNDPSDSYSAIEYE